MSKIQVWQGNSNNKSSLHKYVPHSSFLFPGGELQVKLDEVNWQGLDHVRICADIHDIQGIMELLLVTDAVKNCTSVPIDLDIPYIP